MKPSIRVYHRRELLSQGAALAGLLAAGGLLPAPAQAAWNGAAFDAKSLPELTKALGTAAPAESRDITLTAPDIAENGAVVPIGLSTTLPGVRRMLVLVEKNPAITSAIFEVNDQIEASFQTRVKMGQSSNVYAVAILDDGKVLYAQKEVKVTLGGCGG